MRLIPFAALLLGACATSPPLVGEVRTVEVKVPVTVPCVSSDQVPVIPVTKMDPKQDVRQLATAAAVDLEQLQTYAERADALLRSCVATKEKQP
jgi:hypothetical protein